MTKHRKAFLASLAAGAVIGLVIGFVVGPGRYWGVEVWLHDRPADAVFWMLVGAVVAGIAAYVWRLSRSN